MTTPIHHILQQPYFAVISMFIALAAPSLDAVDLAAGTTDAYLAQIQEETQIQKAAWSDEWASIMQGAAIACGPWTGIPRSLARMEEREPQRAQHYHAFLTVWQPIQEALCSKIVNSKELSADEEKFRFIASAHIFFDCLKGNIKSKTQKKETLTASDQAYLNYCTRMRDAGTTALSQAYSGKKITADMMKDLRLYSIYVDIRHTGQGILPAHLGLTRGQRKPSRAVGEIAPEFALATMESFLNSEDYSDANPWQPVNLFTPLVSEIFLHLISGYTLKEPGTFDTPDSIDPASGIAVSDIVIPTAYDIRPGHEDEIVRLSDYRNKKPVLLIFMDPSDALTWHGRVTPYLKPLKQALGDRIVFHYINTTIHDSRMPSMDFLTPRNEQRSTVQETTMEARARGSKMFHLYDPASTVDYLLDDMAQHFRNQWSDQGGGAYFVLIDRQGRIAYTDYLFDVPITHGENAIDFYYEYLTIRMNYLEAGIKRFFDNDLLYVAQTEEDRKAALPQWRSYSIREFPKRAQKRVQDVRRSLWMPARISSYDAASNTLVIERQDLPFEKMKGLQMWNALRQKNPENAAQFEKFRRLTQLRLNALRHWAADTREHPTYTINLNPEIDIFRNGRALPSNKLKVGDTIGVFFYINKEQAKTEQTDKHLNQKMRPLQIRVYDFEEKASE